MSFQAELILDARAGLGEGPLWHAPSQRLYWVNIDDGEFHVFDPSTGQDRVYRIGQPVGTVVPRKRGGVMLAVRDGFGALDLATGEFTLLVRPAEHAPGLRFNDGKCDPAGRFWAGTLPLEGRGPVGSLYRLDADLRVTQMVTGISCSNGIVWSADKRTMYYIDTPTLRVDAFDYDDQTGAIANRRPAIEFPKGVGYPDGSTLDSEDMLWVAHWGGARVTRWNPRTGQHLGQIDLPVPHVTACAFGGPKLDRLYITTARTGMSPEALAKHPQAGGLFVAHPGVQGLPAAEFGG